MARPRYSEFVQVRGRFHRSVNLAGDWNDPSALNDYITTPTTAALAERILAQLRDPAGSRSWSITGPYGTGKSAFALLLSDLLCRRGSEPARQLARSFEWRRRRLLPVLVTAERGPIETRLIDALAGAVSPVDRSFGRSIRRRKRSASELPALFSEAAQRVREHGFGGIVLIVDELGKFLEFAAAEEADLFVLQQLAESASRSRAPFLFLTLLHSSFADYLPSGQRAREAEWRKIQGRFTDAPFQLPTEQFLGLVAHAIEAQPSPAVAESWKSSMDELLRTGVLEEAERRLPARELLSECFPLHPLSALLLWPVFRSKLAQNERSLFGFLSHPEPGSFHQFLGHTTVQPVPPLYRLHDLYDYIRTTLGMAASIGTAGRKWAIIESSLDRIPPDAPAVAAEVVKTVGLVALYGPSVGLSSSADLIRAAIGRDGVDAAIAALESKSILVFRAHSDSYALWEGSDFDVEAAFAEARGQVESSDWHVALTHHLALRPLVARSHYIQKGTLRFLDVEVISGSHDELLRTAAKETNADGRIIFLMSGETSGEREASLQLAADVTRMVKDHICVIAIPKVSGAVRDAWCDYQAWTHVRDHRSELTGDPVARQEVRARIVESRRSFEALAGRAFSLPGQPFDPSHSIWMAAGRQHKLASAREFQRWLSELCEEQYPDAPEFHNEILNRQTLSSPAAAARRTLIEAMLEREDQERLGFEGHPPEATMYESMLRQGGFHQRRSGRWRFARPRSSWRPAWDAAVEFLENSRTQRRPVLELFDLLRRPPIGLRDGPIPVLLTAVLAANRDEVALYEDGIFVPELRIEVFERLLARPGTFEVQSHKLDRVQKAALRALADAPGVDGQPDVSLLTVVRKLVLSAARLPPFAKKTRRLERPEALLVRDALLTAADPKALLFELLPSAVGRRPRSAKDAADFADRVRHALVSMNRAYPALLDRIESMALEAFRLPTGTRRGIGALRQRAEVLVPVASERRLQALVREVSRLDSDRDWREVVARVVNDGLPATHWTDHDESLFQVRLFEAVAEFERLEEIVRERGERGAGRLLRIGLLADRFDEARAFVDLDDVDEERVAGLAEQIRELLDERAVSGGDPDQARVHLVAMTRVLQGLISKGEG